MTSTPRSAERVLVLLAGPASESALEIAARMAAQRQAHLIALLVEDLDLLTTAGLPFACEIGLVSGVARPLSSDALEARLSDRTAHLRQVLGRLAERLAIEAELQVGRGGQAQTVHAYARPDDLLVLYRTHWAQRPSDPLEGVLATADCTVMLAGPRGQSATGGPMVILDGSTGALRALGRALALARDGRGAVILAVAPAVDAQERAHARALLAEHGAKSHVVELVRLDASELLQWVRRARPWLVFVSRGSPLLHGTVGRRFRVELDEVPLVIVP